MKRLLAGLAALWLFGSALAQETGIEAGFGMAGNRMDDMKHLQEFIVGNYPVEGKIISSFPAYTTGSIGLVRQIFPTVQIGAGYAFSAAGGKSNYTDYSGSISTNMEANSHRLGAWVSFAFLGNERYDLSIYGRLDANITQININSSVYALGYSESVIHKYGSVTPTGMAGLTFYVHFKGISLGVDGGYRVDLPGKLNNREDGDEFKDPVDPQRVLTTDWTGWCAQAKVQFWLNFF